MVRPNIPFVDLGRQFQSLETELTAAFLDIGKSGVYIMGEKLELFESQVAAFCGVKHAIGVGDGSAALFLILKALGVGPGDEVITATNSFIASAWVIVAAGAKPVLVDVCEDLNIDTQKIESAITKRTKAIIPVHLTGRPAAMDDINAIADRYGIKVIEDAAQAIGALYRGRRVGSLGIAAGFSLHPLKNLGVYGDGGVITTNDSFLDEKLRLLRNHGLRSRDECEIWGFNSRLDTLQAAFATIKLAKLDVWNQRCRGIASIYRESLGPYVQVPKDEPWEECAYHNFVIRTPLRDELMLHLLENGVGSRVHYPIPIHLQPSSVGLGYQLGDFPKSEMYAKTMISLPIFPELTDEEVYSVVRVVKSFFENKQSF